MEKPHTKQNRRQKNHRLAKPGKQRAKPRETTHKTKQPAQRPKEITPLVKKPESHGTTREAWGPTTEELGPPPKLRTRKQIIPACKPKQPPRKTQLALKWRNQRENSRKNQGSRAITREPRAHNRTTRAQNQTTTRESTQHPEWPRPL